MKNNNFLEALKEFWKIVPEWRFGQLISNVTYKYYCETKRDIFFAPDEEVSDFLKRYGQYLSNGEE